MVTIDERLSQWQSELLDLTNRNRLLSFSQSTTRPTSLQLIAPDPAAIFQMVLDGKSLQIVGNDDAADEQESDVDPNVDIEEGSQPVVPEYGEVEAVGNAEPALPILKAGQVLAALPTEKTNRVALNLLRRARTSEQEQGITTLFAAFGLLKWREPKSRDMTEGWRRAPLVLLPLKIEEVARNLHYRITAIGDDPEFNVTLSERLRQDFSLDFRLEINEDAPITDLFEQARALISGQPNWEILPEVHVGVFQFHKIRMYTDLAEHAALAKQHEVVQALALDGATLAAVPDGIPDEEDLDRVVPPQQSYTVLDADASQLRAIQMVVRGSHLVIQGPPGTGKSQTIANAIAECIAAGKTVLFVSEKAAAIEVVHRRLAACGLDEFCLMLHSSKANKREIVSELNNRRNATVATASSPEESADLQHLQNIRERLNTYVQALHRPRAPLGKSVFWAQSQVAAVLDAPIKSLTSPPVVDLTYVRLEQWQSTIAQAARYADALAEGSAHPWFGLRHAPPLTAIERGSLPQILSDMSATLNALEVECRALSAQLKLPAPRTLQAVRNLSAIARAIPIDGELRPSWFDPRQIHRAKDLAGEASQQVATARNVGEPLLARYDKSLLDLATSEIIASYEQSGFVRFFSFAHRRYRSQVRAAASDGQQRPVADELATLRTAAELNQHIEWLREHQSDLSEVLGLTYHDGTLPNAGAWTQRAHDVEAAAAILAVLPGDPPSEFVTEVCRPGAGRRIAAGEQRLTELLARFDAELAQLSKIFTPDALVIDGVPFADADLGPILSWLDVRQQRFNELDQWLSARAAYAEAERVGVGNILSQLVASEIPAEQWADALRRLVLTHWRDRVVTNDQDLADFQRENHEELIDRFKELDRRSIKWSVPRLRRVQAERQGSISTAYGGEPKTLAQEAFKKRRQLPLRRLFAKIPTLLVRLKPCLMMSPLSVAQFLPADLIQFDIVIFDEASQVRPYDAVGAIMRGKQLVVAGDSKQLPPSAFFERDSDNGDDDEDEDGSDIRLFESILDVLGSKGAPSTELRWHYRSRHESLIAFSNHYFYDDKLITFPSDETDIPDQLGVHFVPVRDGLYESVTESLSKRPVRVNKIEAQRVADLVMMHARTRPEESLGVVALNQNQRDAIDDALREQRDLDRAHEEFFQSDKPDPFFIKALEEVQGDERDVMVISIGFGKNKDGVLWHNFGPINQKGGERRLNVLVTRARLQTIIVSSIRAGDILEARTSQMGPLRLKQYLAYAEDGPDTLDTVTTREDDKFESPFEMAVAEELRKLGHEVHTQVGCSKFRIDLAIVDRRRPERYLLGIECDGATYHQSKTARDRDRLRQEILENLGWRIHRIWSTDWIMQRDRELVRVVARINELLSEEPTQDELPCEEEIDFHPAPERSVAAIAEPAPDDYEPAIIPKQHDLITVPYRVAELSVDRSVPLQDMRAEDLAPVVTACVEVEGPIHRELLAAHIAKTWELGRAGRRIQELVLGAVRIAARRGQVRYDGDFVWPTALITPNPRAAAPDGWNRNVKYIADEEILQCMKLLLERAMSLMPEELITETAREFGYQRTGSDIRDRFWAVLRRAEQDGTFDHHAERVQLPR